ncbi:xylulose kinase-like protein [Phlyctochytrium arcticum]|nr:xylulose kinase-like protein [Phlyctochytrium arcticum]
MENLPHLYLGLDLSTQQLKATVMDNDCQVVAEHAVQFDSDLLHYKTSGGSVINGLEATSSVLMWVEALDLLLERMKALKVPFDRIAGISGCGQQHGTVYWRSAAEKTLAQLNIHEPLMPQLKDAFSVTDSPIWQDSRHSSGRLRNLSDGSNRSTYDQCRMLERAVGGPEKLAELTGSSGYERFSGSQILKRFSGPNSIQHNTERISLVSSFLASLFLGTYAPIDASDGSGMNLLDIQSRDWDDRLLDVCGPNMRQLLGKVCDSLDSIGTISPYFAQRYGFPSNCVVTAFTGDNPDSLASLNLGPTDIVISLGTSDTVILSCDSPRPSCEGHVLVHPTFPGRYMAMLVFKNGSLTRELLRDKYAGCNWDTFNQILSDASTQCGDHTGFYFPQPETTPRAKGIYRFKDMKLVDEFPEPQCNLQALLDSQFLSMRMRARRLGYDDTKSGRRILATGGASQNQVIVQVLADVFGAAVVCSVQGTGSAALGAAYRARYGLWRQSGFVGSFQDSLPSLLQDRFQEMARPDLEAHQRYTAKLPVYEKLEEQVRAMGHF